MTLADTIFKENIKKIMEQGVFSENARLQQYSATFLFVLCCCQKNSQVRQNIIQRDIKMAITESAQEITWKEQLISCQRNVKFARTKTVCLLTAGEEMCFVHLVSLYSSGCGGESGSSVKTGGRIVAVRTTSSGV